MRALQLEPENVEVLTDYASYVLNLTGHQEGGRRCFARRPRRTL